MNGNGVYEFYPTFKEFLSVYRDVKRVWIGDGSGGDNNESGMLYAEYANSRIVELGYVTLYPIAVENGYEGTESEWIRAIVNMAATDKGATASVSYQNSTSGTNPPSGGTWSNLPNPQQGQYVWTRVVLRWVDGTTSTLYSVSYVGIDSSVEISSVNGKTGVVVVRGDDIEIAVNNSKTIKQYIDELTFEPVVATDAQIDAMFENT